MMKRFLVAGCAALGCLCGFKGVAADDTAIVRVGGAILPMDEHPSVVLVSQHVHARVYRRYALVECVFFLRNDGPETSVEIGFPHYDNFDNDANRGFEYFESYVDGRRVDVAKEKNEGGGPSLWYTKEVAFAAGELKTIRNAYKGGISFDTSDRLWFTYVLKTGSSWSGPIESASIVVSFEDFATDLLTGIKPAGYEIDAREVRWAFSGFEPTDDIEIVWESGPETRLESELHRLAALGDVEGVRRLLDLRVPVDSISMRDYRMTPLRSAVRYGAGPEMVAFLLERGADPNSRAWQTSPFNDAVTMDYPSSADVVRLLLEHGADIDERIGNGRGKSALTHAMCSHAPPEVIEVLIDAGADLNAIDTGGNTALHLSGMSIITTHTIGLEQASALAYEKIKLLLEYGADPNVRNKRGMTPLDLAETEAIAELLVSYGAVKGAEQEGGPE